MIPTVLVGECTGRLVPELQRLGWGRMWMAIGRNIYTYPGEPWGFDNGAFRDHLAGRPFNSAAYRERLPKVLHHASKPILAVIPDKVAASDSLAFSLHWRDELPDLVPWYLALQDGMKRSEVLPHVHRFAGLFLGGSDRFKSRAREWCAFAHDHGLRFHYGRAGTPLKLDHALESGADSLDSTFPMWTKKRFRYFESIVLNGHPQGRLAIV